MAETFATLTQELADRGFSHLSSTRRGSMINRAYQRLAMAYRWQWREDSAQGAAPLQILTLGTVEIVSNETRKYLLEEVDYATLLDWGVDLSTTGTPVYWYRSSPGGAPVVDTYPTSTDTIGVQFWAVPPVLTGTDSTWIPDRYDLLVVDIAAVIAYEDSDNFDAAERLQASVDKQIAGMADDLLAQQEVMYTRMTGASTDG